MHEANERVECARGGQEAKRKTPAKRRFGALITSAPILLFAFPGRAEGPLPPQPDDSADGGSRSVEPEPAPVDAPEPLPSPTAEPTTAVAARAARDPDEKPRAERTRTAQNALYVELLGNGGLYSINYERIFGDSSFSVRVGASILPQGEDQYGGRPLGAFSSTLPILANYYIGGMNHKLQLGAGVTLMHMTLSTDPNDGRPTTGDYIAGYATAITFVIGYRYLPAKGGVSFSAGFTPLIFPRTNVAGPLEGKPWVLPLFGLGIGGVF